MNKRLAVCHYTIILCLAYGSLMQAGPTQDKPKLTNTVIKWLDNKPLALDCAAMADIVYVRRELRKMQYGVRNSGFYLFDGELRTLHWLAEYERTMQKTCDDTTVASLAVCLEAVKQDFLKANAPFSTKMEGTKQMLIKLVEEFCVKYNRPHSFLLEWADMDDGAEADIFEQQIKNLQIMDAFVTDFVDFLEALYYSCEKARAEFESRYLKR